MSPPEGGLGIAVGEEEGKGLSALRLLGGDGKDLR